MDSDMGGPSRTTMVKGCERTCRDAFHRVKTDRIPPKSGNCGKTKVIHRITGSRKQVYGQDQEEGATAST